MILRHRLEDRPEQAEIKIVRDYAELPSVECFAGPLNQVFMNVLTNAIDAIEEKSVTQTECNSRPGQIILQTALVDGRWAQITIADSGSGISPEIQSRIFEPFFTTKPVGKGTGMGMSISYQTVTEKHKGELSCFSTPGEGTEFVIQIPIRP